MKDNRMPNPFLYDELADEKRPETKLKLRYKDCMKKKLQRDNIIQNDWGNLNRDSSGKQCPMVDFKHNRIEHEKFVHKGLDVNLFKSVNTEFVLTGNISSRVSVGQAVKIIKDATRRQEINSRHII